VPPNAFWHHYDREIGDLPWQYSDFGLEISPMSDIGRDILDFLRSVFTAERFRQP
jgi:hypothetical protein